MAEALFDGDAIRAASLVRHVEIHDEIGSTNDRAAELAQEAATLLPTLVVTRRQMAGRGRGQNLWASAEGALTFSILLQPSSIGIATSNWPQLSLATAVAICDVLGEELQAEINGNENGGASLGIKWPNDVMLNDRKVCGILIESPAATIRREQLIIGIGINVNNSWQREPVDVSANRIALCDASSRCHDLQRTLLRLLTALETRLKEVATQDPCLPRAWQKLCWLRGKRIEVSDAGRTIEGMCVGTAEDGRIVIQSGSKSVRLLSGSVRFFESPK
ncbi:MAG TPA: biotin--[acetyl-CoA-carboxylase] ligase [Lacipirellulaceae bacterium]|jgi:BirA family biotin operon repressor/biotin-[acetyl-CoA-carboxylase] ligase|nr:biotin--[acetyl-CoA-carboxylase] ligase [Lacipirellulaceae bacterium]